MSEPIGNTKQLAEPVAVRYDFDGYGYMYINAGSGTDWASWMKDAELLFTHPQKELTDEEIAIVYKKVIETSGHNFAYEYARAIIKASRGEK